MRKIILLLVIVCLFFLAGCQERKYVCEDGTIVDDNSKCNPLDLVIEIIDDPEEENYAMQKEEKEDDPEIITKFEGDFHDVDLEIKERGVTLRFIGYYYLKKGDDFGKITGVRYSINNEGVDLLTPGMKLRMANNAGAEDLRVVDVERDLVNISVGDAVVEDAKTALSFNKLDIEKTLKLEVYDKPRKGTNILTVEAIAQFS